MRINLLPWRKEQIKIHNLIFGIISGVFATGTVALCLLVAGILRLSVYGEQSDIDYLRKEIQQVETKITEIQGLKKKRQFLMDQEKVIQSLQASRPFVVKLFDSIARAIPDGTYITEFVRQGNILQLQGITDSNSRVSVFMRNLQQLDWLSGADLLEINSKNVSQSDNDIPVIGFQLRVSFHL